MELRDYTNEAYCRSQISLENGKLPFLHSLGYVDDVTVQKQPLMSARRIFFSKTLEKFQEDV